MAGLTEGLEDYLEAILICEKEHRFVRTKHIAEKLDVSSPSAHAAVKELTRMGLVEHESYGYIELTPKGRKEAENVYGRHRVLYRFFSEILGLPPETSEANACGIEHHFDDLTLMKFTKFLDFLTRKLKENEEFDEELERVLTDE
ncbi:metal-dependent transcriptional regulator [candidate division WOR-3 bacterium]|nr:metal-dependent transcriptional regulator [candidate division WOR-3 bacterium]